VVLTDVKSQLRKLFKSNNQKKGQFAPFFIGRDIYNGMIIYKITNKVNNKIYIGKSLYDDESYMGSGLSINNALKKYGKENFIKETIEICEDQKTLNERERFWIKKYNSTSREIGYNIAEGGNGGNTRQGYDENKMELYYKKLSEGVSNSVRYQEFVEKRKGTKNPKISSKLKELYSKGIIKPWNLGLETSQQTKIKISQKNKGKKMSQDAKRKISESKFVGVLMMDMNDNIIRSFTSIKEASEIMKINRCCISDCLNGRQKTAGGYKWKLS
jgi:group I intron endonuclease